MRNTLKTTGNRISRFIDFFYPPFRKYMTLQFFRYGFTGATNVAVSIVIYFVVYTYILRQHMLPLGFFTLSSHIAALVISFPFSNFFGFLLQKYVTFTESELRGHVQLYRYFIVVFINLGINAIILKLLVEVFHFWTTPSQIAATFFCILVSYFSQKKFTFKNQSTKVV
ncbi:MAG: GtrA family protein [Paludibacter sp.]|nr:GtrA family protein [Paludibacter sp.]